MELKHRLAHLCIHTARKLGIPVLHVNTQVGYDIATALRGPDYPADNEFYDVLKYIFTARIRELMGCDIKEAVIRNVVTKLEVDHLIADVATLLQNMTVSKARCLVHWTQHIEKACLYFGNYPEYAAANLREFLVSTARQSDSPEIQGIKMQNAIKSIRALLEHECTHPDTCWQLPKEWK